MKCQSLFPGESMKNITNLSSAEFTHRVVKINNVINPTFSLNSFTQIF